MRLLKAPPLEIPFAGKVWRIGVVNVEVGGFSYIEAASTPGKPGWLLTMPMANARFDPLTEDLQAEVPVIKALLREMARLGLVG
jgi:hypothetical protein